MSDFDEQLAKARRKAALATAEVIRAALLALEASSGLYVEEVRVDTRNFANLATEIMMTTKARE